MLCNILFGLTIFLSWRAPSADGDCGYGDPQQTEGSSVNENGQQYVDLDHPLTCSGSLVSLKFCFYTEDLIDNERHMFYLRIYRRESEVLERVHLMEKEVMGPSESSSQSFICREHIYASGEYVPVLEGDIIAVYLPSLTRALEVVGTNIPGVSLYKDTRFITTQAFSTTVTESSLEEMPNTALHFSAVIVNNSPPAFRNGSSGISTAPERATTVLSTFPTQQSTHKMETPTISSSPSTFVSHTNTPLPVPESSRVHTTSTDINRRPVLTQKVTDSRTISSTFSLTIIPAPSISVPLFVDLSTTEAIITTDPRDEAGRRTGTKSWAMALALATTLLLLLVVVIFIVTIFLCLRKRRRKQQISSRGVAEVLPNTDQDHIYEMLDTHSREVKDQCQQEAAVDTVYSVIGPETDSGHKATRAEQSPYMHYEMDVFGIFSGGENYDKLSLRIRKVMSSLKEKTPTPFHAPASEEKAIYEQLSTHNPTITIPADQILVKGHLGSGHFASVKKGEWSSGEETREVALKSLHRDAGEMNRVKCLQEAAIMAQFHHPNIVYLHGLVIGQDNTISLVMEFLHGGNLSEMLINRYSVNGADASTPHVILNYCIHITLGMMYLSDKGFIHRDLAARNILISDRNICKIGDFGMSRDLEESNYYHSEGGTIPIKWTAPEAAFYGKYSSASDVWSYGCVLYEIWSLGETPFSSLHNKEVLETIRAGNRLPPPPGCPYEIYKLMIDCWNPVPAERPTFKDILCLLISDEEKLLTLPFEDVSTHCDACRLGASLRAGHKMYPALQAKYLSTPVPTKPSRKEEIYEAIP